MLIAGSILYWLERKLFYNIRQTTPLRDHSYYLSCVLLLAADSSITTSYFVEYQDAILDNYSARNIGSLSRLIRLFFF